ncbi:hypothetical protein MPER_09641, partial [Moniliophthora perniciosa FA553]
MSPPSFCNGHSLRQSVECHRPLGMPFAKCAIASFTVTLKLIQLLGYLLNYGLYDIYYTAFPNDRKAFQRFVYGVYLVETIQTVMITYDAFQQFAYGFADPAALDKINLMIYTLSKSKALAGIIFFMAFTQFSGAVATGVLAKIVSAFSKLRARCFIAACFWLGGSAAADITIAVSMIYILLRYDTGFQETQDL